jgi:hypothetical protein
MNADEAGDLLRRMTAASPLRFARMVRAVMRSGGYAALLAAAGVPVSGNTGTSSTRKLGNLCRKLFGKRGDEYLAMFFEEQTGETMHRREACRRLGLSEVRDRLQWHGFAMGEPGDAGQCSICARSISARRVYRLVKSPPRETEHVYCRRCAVSLMAEDNPVWGKVDPSPVDMMKESFAQGDPRESLACKACGFIIPGAEAFRYEPWDRQTWPMFCLACAVEEMAETDPGWDGYIPSYKEFDAAGED